MTTQPPAISPGRVEVEEPAAALAPLYHLVLLDDDDHTYGYVIEMLGKIFGYGRDKYPAGNTGQWRGGERYHLFAVDRSVQPAPKKIPTKKPRGKKKKRAKPTSPNYRWTTTVPLLTKAMLVADRTLFIAGPPDVAKTKAGNRLNLSNAEDVLSAWNNSKGGLLWAVDVDDGKKLAAYPLASPPVFDGMAATSGRLFIATADGHVLCLSGR